MSAAAIVQILNIVESLFTWLTSRGLTRDRVLTILNTAQAEGRDVTTAEVQAELDLLQGELDDTQEAIDNLDT